MRVEISVEHRRRETPGTSGKRQAASRTFTSGSLRYECGDKTNIGFVFILEQDTMTWREIQGHCRWEAHGRCFGSGLLEFIRPS